MPNRLRRDTVCPPIGRCYFLRRSRCCGSCPRFWPPALHPILLNIGEGHRFTGGGMRIQCPIPSGRCATVDPEPGCWLESPQRIGEPPVAPVFTLAGNHRCRIRDVRPGTGLQAPDSRRLNSPTPNSTRPGPTRRAAASRTPRCARRLPRSHSSTPGARASRGMPRPRRRCRGASATARSKWRRCMRNRGLPSPP